MGRHPSDGLDRSKAPIYVDDAMWKLKSARVLAAATLTTVALGAVGSGAVAADPSSPVIGVAAAKKKKKKKATPFIATVNGTVAVREDDPNGFGGDGGPRWQQLNVTIKDAKIPFNPAYPPTSAGASVLVRFDYRAEAHTANRSWAVGCDREDHVSSDNRSVPLMSINTAKDQVATVKGSIKFNKPVRR